MQTIHTSVSDICVIYLKNNLGNLSSLTPDCPHQKKKLKQVQKCQN